MELELLIRDAKQVEQVRASCECNDLGVFLHAMAAPKASMELTSDQLTLIRKIVDSHLLVDGEHRITLRVEMHEGRNLTCPVV